MWRLVKIALRRLNALEPLQRLRCVDSADSATPERAAIVRPVRRADYTPIPAQRALEIDQAVSEQQANPTPSISAEQAKRMLLGQAGPQAAASDE